MLGSAAEAAGSVTKHCQDQYPGQRGQHDSEDDAEEPHEEDRNEDGEEFEDLDPGDAQLAVGDGGQGQGDVPHVLGADGHGNYCPAGRRKYTLVTYHGTHTVLQCPSSSEH